MRMRSFNEVKTAMGFSSCFDSSLLPYVTKSTSTWVSESDVSSGEWGMEFSVLMRSRQWWDALLASVPLSIPRRQNLRLWELPKSDVRGDGWVMMFNPVFLWLCCRLTSSLWKPIRTSCLEISFTVWWCWWWFYMISTCQYTFNFLILYPFEFLPSAC